MKVVATPSRRLLLNYVSYFSQGLRLPSFSHFPLHSSIHSYLQANNIHTPTYIQYALLSSLHKGSTTHHLTSPTGSGKTLAYMLPMCSSLKHEEDGVGPLTASQRPRGIVLTASKELVVQGRSVGKAIAHHCKLKIQGVNIGRSRTAEKELLRGGLDVLISTQQRLLPMLEEKELFLTQVRWMVIDQVDTLWQMGRLPGVLELARRASRQGVQLVLSGTTCSKEMQKYLEKEFENLSRLVDKDAHLNLHNIRHEFLHCPDLDKHSSLLQALGENQTKTIVFCNTISSLHELQYFLEERGLTPLTLHSDLSKQARLQNFQLFRDGQHALLLSTDLAARGLDIPDLQKVINYDFPLSTCDYLQRAGRTGRAGKAGQVITLYHRKNMPLIEQLRGASFDQPLKINNSAYRMRNKEERTSK